VIAQRQQTAGHDKVDDMLDLSVGPRQNVVPAGG